MRNRTGLMRELRQQLIKELVAQGKPREWAEVKATEDIQEHKDLLKRGNILRHAVREGRV